MGEPLSESDMARLIKLCGMMGSAHAGERDAAVGKVNAFLVEHKLTWADVLTPPPALPAVQVTVGDEDVPPPITWQVVALQILQRYQPVLRGDRELEFVQSLLQRGYGSLTPPQEKWLRDIARRAGLSWP